VKFDVVVYKDDEGAVRARVTFMSFKVADAVTEVRKSSHSAASLKKLKVEYTLAPESEDYALTHVVLRFLTPDYMTVTYDDGLNGEVFEKEVYYVSPNSQTPPSKIDGSDPTSLRRGYLFAGWDPERTELVEKSVDYTAIWKIQNYTITYEGVPAGVENPNPTTYTIHDEVVLKDLDTDGFVCWLDEDGNAITSIPKGSTGNRVLTAKIVAKPTMPKIGTNVVEGLLKFQCTTHEEHTWTDSTAFSTNAKNVTWNAETQRWESYVSVKMANINNTQVKKNYFGGITHYYENNSPRVDVYYDPDAQGTTATGNPVTGMWFAVDGTPVVLDVTCYDTPAAPKTVTTKLWVRDWTKLANYEKTTKLIDGTYTVGDVYGDRTNGFFVDVTINDLSAYISSKMAAKTNGAYIIDPVQNGATITYRMKYTGSTTDLKQDGSGWSIYTNEWTATEKNNGKLIWVLPQWTTTYTDGADGEAFADKVIVYPETSNDVVQDILKTGSIATPSFGADPKRTGYTFLGWEPAVSEKLTDSVTYTAKWIQNPAVPSGSNSLKELFKFHCTVDGSHADQTYNWFGSYVKYNGDMAYDATRGVFTATANITNVQTMLSSGVSAPEKVWGMKHYHTDEDGNTVRTATIHLVWDPSASGQNASGTDTTGLWVPDGEQLVNVWCATEPAMPKLAMLPRSQQTTTAIRVISVDEPLGTRATPHNVPTYFKYLTEGSYTMSAMEKDSNGDYWVTLVIDPSSYLTAFNDKNSGEPAYWVDEEKTTADFTYKLRYSDDKTNYAQDGSGWTVDSSSYADSFERKYSKILYVTNKYTVTYTDGVEETEVFPDQTYRVVSGSKTPAFDGTPERTGYTFEGWTPDVAETVTADATYAAKWNVVEYTITYEGVPEGVENTNPTTYTVEGLTLNDLVVDGFLGWDDGSGNVLTAIPAGTTGDLTLTAKFATVPVNGPGNGNSVMNDAANPWINFHCATSDAHADYSLLSLWGNAYDLSYSWDSARKVYVGTATVKLSSLLDYANGSVVKAMGGVRHYSVDGLESVTVHGVWVVDETSAKGGLWYPDGETPVVNLKCNTEPAAPTADQLSNSSIYNSSTKLWIRDWTNTGNWVRQTTLLPGTFTVGQMTKQPSNANSKSTTWTIPITITDLQPYAALLEGKSTGTYTVDMLQTTTSLTYELKYTFTPGSSSLEPDQTGTKWTLNMSGSEGSNGKPIWVLPQWTITYTDGADGKVFADKTIVVPASSADIAQNALKTGKLATPAFGEDPAREGYTFAGWTPEVAANVTENATYTAKWDAIEYSITYAGVPEGVENANPDTYTADGLTLTDLAVDGFLGWEDCNGNVITAIPAGTTGDLTLTAKIVEKPVQPKIGTNVAADMLKIQCTTHGEHVWTNSSAFSTNSRNVTWNAETKRWESYVSVSLNQINLTQPKKNYFGGITHYYEKNNPTVNVYYVPDAQGSTSTGNPVTGLWYAVDGNPAVLDVTCYDTPAAPKTVTTKLWVRDWTKLANYVKTTSLIDGTYTVGSVYGDKSNGFFVDVTITNLAPYISSAMQAKSTGTYIIDPVQNSGSITYRMKYTGSTTDLKQDGSGWSIYTNEWTGTDKNNGKTIWVLPQWTTTYKDGADGSVFADKSIVFPQTSNDVAQDVLKSGSIATPGFGEEPAREGYSFAGWSPEVADEMTASVTYTAQWTEAETEELTEEEEPVEVDPDGEDEVVDPTDPTEPADPADPVDPADPAAPVEPTEPVAPVEPTDPAEPVEPGEEETPVEPGKEEETPAEPGKDEETPAQPGKGEETPAEPGKGEETPAQPGTGEKTPEPGKSEEQPPVTPAPPVASEPAPAPVVEPAPDPEKDNG